MSPAFVGILVNNRLYEGIPSHRTGYEHLALYEQSSQAFDLQPCYFRLEDVDLPNYRVFAYVNAQGSYVRKWMLMPQVVHNRAIHLDHHAFLTLAHWQQSGVHIFNSWNRYNKWYIHQLLQKDRALHQYLPVTYPATEPSILRMKNQFTSLIIKPNKSSVGRGIMKLEQRTKHSWQLTYPKNLKITNHIWRRIATRSPLSALVRRRIHQQAYIVQQCIALATVDDRPYDVRVSVQRGRNGNWGITGMIGKLASKKQFLTNVGQGGTAYPLPTLLAHNRTWNAPKIIEDVEQCALKIATHLSHELPHLADLGLDIAVCENGWPMFIECNGKDQRYTFRQAGLHAEWQATYTNPMAYARYLLDAKRG